MSELECGWYFVVIKNDNKGDNQCSKYNEWVELTEEGWDLSGMGNVSVLNVLKKES